MQAVPRPSTRALFLALHPPRRFWPEQVAGYYISPNQPSVQPRQRRQA